MERLIAVGTMLQAAALFQRIRDPDGYGIIIGVGFGAVVFLVWSFRSTDKVKAP